MRGRTGDVRRAGERSSIMHGAISRTCYEHVREALFALLVRFRTVMC